MKLCCFTAPGTKDKNKSSSSGPDLFKAPSNVHIFSLNELKSATRNFHPANRIGRGGFGVVHKGLLRSGIPVAVKSLSAESKQGANEFLTEIGVLSSIRHPNLVELIGCCVEGQNRVLVYEYLDNSSLENALLGPKNMKVQLDWAKRSAICLGTATGLLFLHEEAEPPIVHRDIKASNILLSSDFDPKIGDFGLAKLFPDNLTHISTRVAGTMSYLAPEYALLGQLTKKADIYSFGVLILEIVSGQSSGKSIWGLDMKNLVEWTWKLRDEGRLLDVVDPELEGYPDEEVLHFIKAALCCTQGKAHQRPSMKEVLHMLHGGIMPDVQSIQPPSLLKEKDSAFQDAGSSSGNSQAHQIKSTAGNYISTGNTITVPASAVDISLR